MKHSSRLRVILAIWAFLAAHSLHADTATGTRGAVATVQPLATQAGIAAFEAGGNAVDAAVAAALTLGIVDNHNSGLGGGCFVVIRLANGRLANGRLANGNLTNGRLVTIDGREMAPAAATRDMYLEAGRRLGKPPTELSTTGPLAVGTPGALAAYAEALKSHGRLQLADLLRRAADIAERGFPIDSRYAANLKRTSTRIGRFPGSRAVLLKTDGTPYRQGEILKQPDLAATYRNIAQHGPDWFYRGELAETIGSWMADNGGILTAADFAAYRTMRRKPVVTSYRDYTIVGMPPPSSGGVHVAQILNILEHFDLRTLYENDPAVFTHVVAEAMKLAFADRAHWLGDSDFADVPRGLVSKEYAAELAKRIDPDRTTPVDSHGVPPGYDRDFFAKIDYRQGAGVAGVRGHWRGPLTPTLSPKSFAERVFDVENESRERFEGEGARACGPSHFAIRIPRTAIHQHTTHIATADADGNWVAITATVNTSFGSKVIVPGTGLPLNNEMDDFSIAPGVPNAFGLIGAEANEIAPGKRPLSSMSPTIVLHQGKPVLTCGAAGGPKIITQVVLTIVRVLDLGMPVDKAVKQPRFHHQWRPRRLTFERATGADLPWSLARRGHLIHQITSGGVTQAIVQSADGQSADGMAFTAVSDPRVPGKATGW